MQRKEHLRAQRGLPNPLARIHRHCRASSTAGYGQRRRHRWRWSDYPFLNDFLGFYDQRVDCNFKYDNCSRRHHSLFHEFEIATPEQASHQYRLRNCHRYDALGTPGHHFRGFGECCCLIIDAGYNFDFALAFPDSLEFKKWHTYVQTRVRVKSTTAKNVTWRNSLCLRCEEYVCL